MLFATKKQLIESQQEAQKYGILERGSSVSIIKTTTTTLYLTFIEFTTGWVFSYFLTYRSIKVICLSYFIYVV